MFLLPFRRVNVGEAGLVGRLPVHQGEGVTVLNFGDDAGEFGSEGWKPQQE